MRVGMIGLDTSHVVEFTKIFQDPRGDADLESIQIVAGVPAGTDLPISRDRVGQFSAQLADMNVELVDEIDALLDRVDAVMLTSVDGNVHLQQALPILRAGKPLYIDKPLAGSLTDAIEISQLSRQYSVPCFSSSCMRYSPAIVDAKQDAALGKIIGASTWGPCHLQDNIPDLYFYGLHGIEALFSLMGTGCEAVQRTHHRDVDLVVGTWKGGRVGTFRGMRGATLDFGANVFGSSQTLTLDLGIPYRQLCVEVARFFRSGIAPVSLKETIEIFSFMEAADASKQRGGRPVPL